MNQFGRESRRAALVLVLAASTLCGRPAAAQGNEDTVRDASQHFRRGVELYSEADYAGALVEFRRAYGLSPNPTALYNAGEAQYQLQDYAGALKTFRRYLAEAGPSESHRTEVEGHVQVLRTRVGRVNIASVPSGADVIVDDQAVGKTPLGEPVVVSIGHRKIIASMPGRLPVTQYVDVAAGDEAQITLSLPSAGEIAMARPVSETRPEPVDHDRAALRTVGWIGTGVLAAGAITFGVLALNEAHVLGDARASLTTSDVLAHDSNLTTTYSALADSLAAAAIVVGGLSLYWTLSSGSGSSSSSVISKPRVAVGLGSARFEMNF